MIITIKLIKKAKQTAVKITYAVLEPIKKTILSKRKLKIAENNFNDLNFDETNTYKTNGS